MTPRATKYPLPRGPVLDWCSFSNDRKIPHVPSIDDIRNAVMTTSGRAAIYQALLQLRLAPGSTVLVPTYHCPTIIAPAVLANLEVAYFGIRPDGLPNLKSIEAGMARKAKAMIVPHYFGLARSLAEVRDWCDQHRIALIEDCAHCYFGNAGERPVGTWGDFSTASLSKFFPIPEGGVLASATTPITALRLSRQSFRPQIKAWVDVIEAAVTCGRLAGINGALAWLFQIKNALGHVDAGAGDVGALSTPGMMQVCEMGRISEAPTSASIALKTILPRGQIIAKRRRNFAIYAKHFEDVHGAQPLFTRSGEAAVPYVFPLWVDEPDRVYQALRAQQMPVFRWDRIWPGTPQVRDDVGASWRHHVLQLLCHQDLRESDITRTALATLSLVSSSHSSMTVSLE
jgi:perosamine synthetase